MKTLEAGDPSIAPLEHNTEMQQKLPRSSFHVRQPCRSSVVDLFASDRDSVMDGAGRDKKRRMF